MNKKTEERNTYIKKTCERKKIYERKKKQMNEKKTNQQINIEEINEMK